MIKKCEKHDREYEQYANGGKFVCKTCSSEAVQKRRRKLKELAVEYKGGKCEICGYNKYIGALEFHHNEPEHKDFGISKTGSTRSFEKIKLEIDKCRLLCSNCHREEHHRLRIE